MSTDWQQLNLSQVWPDLSQVPHFFRRGDKVFQREPLDSFLEAQGIEAPALLRLAEKLPTGAYMGGGYFTSLLSGNPKVNDLDLYFNSEQALRQTIDLFVGEDPSGDDSELYGGYDLGTPIQVLLPGGPERVFLLSLLHPRKPRVELIKAFWFESAEHVIDTFDFTIVQFAMDKNEMVYNPDGLEHLRDKVIVTHRIHFHHSDLQRKAKYIAKGYRLREGA